RDIGRMVLAAEGRKANDSHADCYQYFCVPEYGTANGRLHFHAVHFMRTLPTGSVDPNFGRRVRNRRQLNSLQNTWPYGYSMPIAVRYTQDLTVPRLTLMSLIKMMLVMVSVAAISKTFGLLRFLLRLSFLAKDRKSVV